MKGHKDSSGKFIPHTNSKDSEISSDQVSDDSDSETMKKSDVEKLKHKS